MKTARWWTPIRARAFFNAVHRGASAAFRAERALPDAVVRLKIIEIRECIYAEISAVIQKSITIPRARRSRIITVHELYDKTIKPLSSDDRSRLVGLLLDDLTPDPPNTIRDESHLEELLHESLHGKMHEVTDATWQRRFDRIRARDAKISADSIP